MEKQKFNKDNRMKKNMIVLFIALFLVNVSTAQFICSISPKTKEVGDEITKAKRNSKNAAIVGDYRENGTGWILLNDHTGGFFIENIQTNELLWVLGDINGNLGLEITSLKKELDKENKLQAENQLKFLVNIKSETEIELINTQTLQNTNVRRTKLIPGKVYSKTVDINEIRKPVKEPFNVFSKKYIDMQILNWEKKGEFEKTLDWQKRINVETKNNKIEELNEDAIKAYAESLHIKLGFCYIGASLSLGFYDADKEVYIINSKDFGNLEVPVPIDQAQQFKGKSWCSDDSEPTNVIYFIINNELALASATFWDKYNYVNPLAKNLIKTKNEVTKDIDNNIYNTAGIDKVPEFIGGLDKFYKFVGQNFNVPEEEGLRGKVFVTFIVEKDGSISDIKVLRDIGYGTGKEAIRVLSICPKWIPGEKGGQKVRVLYSIPISINSGD